MLMLKQIGYTITRVVAVAILLPLLSCQAQESKNNKTGSAANGSAPIAWMQFEEAVKLSQQQPKKIFIDVYTHWCGWCKKMDASTFRDSAVVNYINQNFYAVKLDAETRDTILFRDKQFVFVPDYKANELAVSLLSGRMGYPSYVLLDEGFSMMTQPVQSYLTPEDLMPILTYFGNNIYKNTTWEDYMKSRTGN